MRVDKDGNQIYSFNEVVAFGLDLSFRWGIARLPPGQKVRLVNWHIDQNQPVGDPGLVLVEDSVKPEGEVALEGMTWTRCTPDGLVQWIVNTVNGAAPPS